MIEKTALLVAVLAWLVALGGGAASALGLFFLTRRHHRRRLPSARRSVAHPPFPHCSLSDPIMSLPDPIMPHPLVPVGALHLTDGLCYNAPDPPNVEPRGSHA